jgi:hypothetical protein
VAQLETKQNIGEQEQANSVFARRRTSGQSPLPAACRSVNSQAKEDKDWALPGKGFARSGARRILDGGRECRRTGLVRGRFMEATPCCSGWGQRVICF